MTVSPEVSDMIEKSREKAQDGCPQSPERGQGQETGESTEDAGNKWRQKERTEAESSRVSHLGRPEDRLLSGESEKVWPK